MKQTSVSIPEPCSVGWNSMTPRDNGRFCGSCRKVVVDFTKMSPIEVLAYLDSRTNERICGHFFVSQLQEDNKGTNQAFWSAFYQKIKSKKVKGTLKSSSRFLILLLVGTMLLASNCKGGKQKTGDVAPDDTQKRGKTETNAAQEVDGAVQTEGEMQIDVITGDTVETRGKIEKKTE